MKRMLALLGGAAMIAGAGPAEGHDLAARYGVLPLSEGPAYVRKLDRYRDEFLAPGDQGSGD